jgi:hypothetical protein
MIDKGASEVSIGMSKIRNTTGGAVCGNWLMQHEHWNHLNHSQGGVYNNGIMTKDHWQSFTSNYEDDSS